MRSARDAAGSGTGPPKGIDQQVMPAGARVRTEGRSTPGREPLNDPAPGTPFQLPADPPRFLNWSVATQSWYVAARSREVRPGKARSFDLLGRRIVFYREADGTLHALDARCPHLGAELGHGKVLGEEIQCALHHWRVGPDGGCRFAPLLDSPPPRLTRSYPVLERWGLIWFWNGPEPRFPLPDLPAGEEAWYCRFPPRRFSCHPHLLIVNGADLAHFEALHDMAFTAPPRLTIRKPFTTVAELEGHPRSRWARWLTGSRRQKIVARFTTIGGNLAWATFLAPVRFHVLFAIRPDPREESLAQTLFFLPKRSLPGVLRALILTRLLLAEDERVLEHFHFFPGFTDADTGLKAFVEIVNSMEVW